MRTPTILAQVTYDRPDPGLQRGTWAAPRWAIGLLAAVIVVAALAWLVARVRRSRRG